MGYLNFIKQTCVVYDVKELSIMSSANKSLKDFMYAHNQDDTIAISYVIFKQKGSLCVYDYVELDNIASKIP